MIILALEASTTSAKTMLFDTATQDVQVLTRRFETQGSNAVRDGDSVFTQLMALGREAATGHDIDAIALSSTWHGLTLRRPDLSAVTPVYEWPYTGAQGAAALYRRDAEFKDWYYRRTGCMVNAIYPSFKLRHLKDQGVDLKGTIALDQGSLNFARLTGRVQTSHALASGSGLLSTDAPEWDAEVLKVLGIDDVALPELVDGLTTAPLTPDAAAHLGVRAGIPVTIPGPDGGLNQVGEDARGDGDMTFSMGTSGALRYSVPEPSFSPSLSTWTYRSPVGWLSGAATSGCGNCVDWARDLLFGHSTDFSEIEPQLSADRKSLPLFMPFLFGERSPGWQDQRQGGLLELRPEHTRIDMYQGVLTGIVSSLYHCFLVLQEINGIPERIMLSGGVTSSPFWLQMTVDMFGQPMRVSSLQHASAVGAVKMALMANGESPDQPALQDTEPRIVHPNPERTAELRVEFERYLAAYEQTRA
ncbi:gluconokinase [Agrococcus casei]|uniref:gluconokinase n=1 Tax=Agrococcus casei TaxID=343512 RepID=UPI003F8E0B1A